MLEVRELSLIWQGRPLVGSVNLTVSPGEVAFLIGANGVGKSSLILAIAGLSPVERGRVFWDGQEVTHRPHHKREGWALVPEGRQIAPSLTVEETLRLAGGRIARRDLWSRMEEMMQRFPILADRGNQLAGTLSGGEAQLLSLARALMSRPRILLLDEPTLGLSPAAAKAMYETLRLLRAEGMCLFLTDQDNRAAGELADRIYALANHRLEPVTPTSVMEDTI